MSTLLSVLFRSWSRQRKKLSISMEGWIQDALSPHLVPLRHLKRGEQLAPTLLLLLWLGFGPHPCRLPQTLQPSQSVYSCVNKNSKRGFFVLLVLWVFLWICEWFFFFNATVCIYSAHSGILTPTFFRNGRDASLPSDLKKKKKSWFCKCMHACVIEMSSLFKQCVKSALSQPTGPNNSSLISIPTVLSQVLHWLNR